MSLSKTQTAGLVLNFVPVVSTFISAVKLYNHVVSYRAHKSELESLTNATYFRTSSLQNAQKTEFKCIVATALTLIPLVNVISAIFNAIYTVRLSEDLEVIEMSKRPDGLAQYLDVSPFKDDQHKNGQLNYIIDIVYLDLAPINLSFARSFTQLCRIDIDQAKYANGNITLRKQINYWLSKHSSGETIETLKTMLNRLPKEE